MKNNIEIFNEIYINNIWKGDSGKGSISSNAKVYIDTVVNFIVNNNIQSVVDLGSGDTKILREILPRINIESYTCIEISNIAIDRYYKDLKTIVIHDDIISCNYPQCDLILIKDVLQHLSFDSIFSIMDKILYSCKYAIITNDELIDDQTNVNIEDGGYRGLDLTCDPFNYNIKKIRAYPIEGEIVGKNIMLYSNAEKIK